MLTEDDPQFPNWDQDASAADDHYDDQDPAEVLDELETAAAAVVNVLESVGAPEWNRPGRRSDGASFTVATFARYMIHDPVHHIWDVSKPRP